MDSYQNWIGGVSNNIQDFMFRSFSSISLKGNICRFIIHARDMKDETEVKGVYAYGLWSIIMLEECRADFINPVASYYSQFL